MKVVILALATSLSVFAWDEQKKSAPLTKPALKRNALPSAPTWLTSPDNCTVRLEFTIQDGNNKDTFLILCNGNEYTIARTHISPNNEHNFQINGSVQSTTNANKVKVQYSAILSQENIDEGIKGEFTLKGNAALTSGKPTLLGHLGGQTLSLTATIIE
ncbi:MAG: hypothetical protein CMO74_11070 [Verrucomicrobiales bacterium]|nr:hypothetical protein [Verrucomicrobiales bacterium]|tara:strand:+ start:5781 stop:6257 length:477 start_codon:yes stop_codon:yes gene_type:complete